MFAKFTKDMKSTHTILIPTMIDPHFRFMKSVLADEGYKSVLLRDNRANIVEEGLRNVHNDMCYPALLVIGQFIDALKSGEFDTHKVALLISQTGGGCRASNYINLLRKALNESGFGYVPVISLNFGSLDENGFALSKMALIKLFVAIFYGDLMMNLYNQCKPYEKIPNQTNEIYEKMVEFIANLTNQKSFFKLNKNFSHILQNFAKIERSSEPKIRVGIVGEIYLKYSPIGNNGLNAYLIKENAEPVNTGLMDFVLTCIYDAVYDKKLYGKGGAAYWGSLGVAKILEFCQKKLIRAMKRHGFRPPTPFKEVRAAAEGYISHGVKMGEGWLLTAEMVEFMKQGVQNVVCAQPFGCLPNHIIARGMIRKIKQNYPDANIAAIDYDPGASAVNQENRIKLMLSNANREF
ncbi:MULTISPECIES: 2-hydroxyacyl-CoA dehydratase [unclassified Campylobacter]|uniref:2-hydroxyacyl-CoA dehydratase n=1 Tax=unclassified Campylobacter TaxID=2593542 RepID=UPI0022E9D768|nr:MULTISPECIES: 2-hydroxyacyl-CoA dehydratase [unclassified Campylobacter]MDA3055056.1 2-hydroxyacyl-CoA dehydratase [Campylobacter sp. VBCF_07 NA4]MDA3060558.1 2-hydroxyacyl-CoA dehydratase [Campylobacter sp. VBCF_02 NA5]MDA3070176.1 2-hydroxyacyl-CoA dehydratase [Campylobacter sp. VBCF_08 NA3]